MVRHISETQKQKRFNRIKQIQRRRSAARRAATANIPGEIFHSLVVLKVRLVNGCSKGDDSSERLFEVLF
jgi:hypothetical protein